MEDIYRRRHGAVQIRVVSLFVCYLAYIDYILILHSMTTEEGSIALVTGLRFRYKKITGNLICHMYNSNVLR